MPYSWISANVRITHQGCGIPFQPGDLQKTALPAVQWDCMRRHQHWWIISPKCPPPMQTYNSCLWSTHISHPSRNYLIFIVKQNLDSTVCTSPQVPCPSSLLTLEMILRLAIELNLCLGHLVFRSFFGLISNVHFVSLPSLTVLIYHPLLGETPYPLPRKVPWTLPLMWTITTWGLKR